jgi:Flp pilus assembly protein TadD
VRPDWAELHNNLGNALAATQQFSEAAAAYRRSIALGPAYVDAHANLGLVLHRMGRLEEAVAAHRDAIALRPIDARLWLSLSGALIALGRPADAEEACRKAITLDPKLPEARNNLGMALKEKGQLAEAVDSYSIALQLRPDYPEAHNNLGVALHAQGHFSGALAAYEQALGLDASYMDAHWNKALLHLLLGDFETGWREYESGWQVQVGRGHRRHERYPSWNGSPLAGKTLLVWGEQGIGDQIMFASLLPDLIAQGARCIVEADARLEALFCRSFPGLTFVARGDAASAEIEALSIDFQTSMGSVCRWLRRGMNDFPVRPGFLRADPLQVDVPRRRYVERFKGQLVVGISWRGGSGQPGRARSIPLADWAMILQSAGVGFVSLQYGDSARELATIREEFGVEIFRDEAIDPIANLDAFAAQTAAMDLVLSIDNSTVHMAGALNVPVWVLLPAVPEWRWLLGRSDSPWHASARLFRQAVSGDWSAPIAAAADELRQAVSSGKGIRNAAGASS